MNELVKCYFCQAKIVQLNFIKNTCIPVIPVISVHIQHQCDKCDSVYQQHEKFQFLLSIIMLNCIPIAQF